MGLWVSKMRQSSAFTAACLLIACTSTSALRAHTPVLLRRAITSPVIASPRASSGWASRHQLVAKSSRIPTPIKLLAAKKKASADEWRTLLKLCKPDVPLLIVAFLALSLAATGEALMPALQGAAINSAMSIESGMMTMPGGLRASLVRLAGVGVATALFTGIRGFIFWLVGARLVQRLRATLFDALLKQPQAFHDEQGPGELSSRLATDCVKLGDVLSLNINIVLRQIMQSVVGVSIVLRINQRLAALVLFGVALRALFSHYYAQASRAISKAQQDALASSSGVAEQCLSLIKVVRSHGTDASEGRRYRRQLDEVRRK